MRALMVASLGCCLAACAAPPLPPATLTLDHPATPLAAPVEIGRAAWGPFTMACNGFHLRAEARVSVPDAQRRICAAIRAEPASQGAVRLTFSPAGSSPVQLGMTITRAADGSTSAAAITGSDLQAVAPARRAELERGLRNLATATPLPRTLAPGMVFTTGGESSAGMDIALTLACTVSGASTMKRRATIVADCAGAGPASKPLSPGAAAFTGTTTLRGPMAIDVETGLVRALALAVTMQGTAVTADGTKLPVTITGTVRSSLD